MGMLLDGSGGVAGRCSSVTAPKRPNGVVKNASASMAANRATPNAAVAIMALTNIAFFRGGLNNIKIGNVAFDQIHLI
jgi:hypothetical protein